MATELQTNPHSSFHIKDLEPAFQCFFVAQELL